jgi:DNA modification methylase
VSNQSQKNMTIVMKNIAEIKPYENNPRHNETAIDAVASSIKEFGWKQPLVIDKDNVIVVGHTRWLAAKKLGLNEVPCLIASDLTDEQIAAYRLADNKTNELATWDFEKLKTELESISDIDMSQFGFEELEASLDDVKDDEFDEKGAISETPYSKKGDIFILGNHRLMVGDSTLKDDVDKLCEDRSVDLVLTDPPYNVDYEGQDGMKIQNDKQSDEDFYNFLLSAFKNMFEHTKPGGVIYCFHADTEGLNFRNAFKNAGFKLAECLIWVKNSLVLGRQDYQWRHEPCLYGWKEGAGHYFVDDRTQDTILEYDKPRNNNLHPTQKNIELVSKLILNSSRKDETILDLFGGSGTTLIAAEQLGRKTLMMELDEKYADVIVKRFITLKHSVDGCFLIRDGNKTSLSEIQDYKKVLDSEEVLS